MELLTGSCSSLKSHQIFSRNPRGDSRLEEVRFHFPVINSKVRRGPFSLSTHFFSHLRSWAAATAGARIFSMAQLLLFLSFFNSSSCLFVRLSSRKFNICLTNARKEKNGIKKKKECISRLSGETRLCVISSERNLFF